MKLVKRGLSVSVVSTIAVVLATIAVVDSVNAIDRTRGRMKKRAVDSSREQWYVVSIMGSPVGTASETYESGRDGTRTTQHMSLTMSRMGQEINMFVSGETADDSEGRLRYARTTVKASVMTVETAAILENDTIIYTSRSAGFEQTRKIPWEEGAVGLATADLFVADRLRAGETAFAYRTFDLDSGEFKTVRIKRIEGGPVEIEGRMQTPVVYEEYDEEDDVPLATAWLDEDYVPYKTVMVQMGMEIVIERISPEDLQDLDIVLDFDVIRQSMIACENFPDPAHTEDVRLRLRFERAPSESRDFEGPNQSVERRDGKLIELVISRKTLNHLSLTSEERRDGRYIKPDRYIQSENPEIRAIVDEVRHATGAEGLGLAEELAMWVNAHVTNKGYGQGFASALEVLESRAGDCTEHSVLLTALLRAAGIPARPAVGLAYSDGQFVGHMWVEAYVDYWRTIDALDPANMPIRIRISAASNERAVDERDLVRAYGVVGGLQIEVVDFHPTAAE